MSESKTSKPAGLAPYFFIRRGLNYLIHGDYINAYKHLAIAMEFRESFIPSCSAEYPDFCLEMQVLNSAFIILSEKFKLLPPDTECRCPDISYAQKYNDIDKLKHALEILEKLG